MFRQAATCLPLHQGGNSQLFMAPQGLIPTLHKPTLPHTLVHQMAANQIIWHFWMYFICFLSLASHVTSLESRAERLERRRQHPDYKRTMSNLNLQFIAEFLKQKPLIDTTVDHQPWDFDPSGLGEESHWGLVWWLPGIVLTIIALALYVTIGRASSLLYSRPSAQHTSLEVNL